ncbi:MAG: hypothetical protein JO227_02180, partial [Acetobacteraceae bacterium]|nr:hypothetical protein [Acetobacteraceae bacterium]
MPEKPQDTANSQDSAPSKDVSKQPGLSVPQLSLPKGGGAIRGIGEKFAVNPATGTGSITIPVAASPSRGFAPQLSLSYDSGHGNGPFGFGWSLSLPAITTKTDKGLPRFEDTYESRVFILSGAEDLMPALVHQDGSWMRDVVPSRTVFGRQYAIHRYRPRVESLFARIERWADLADPTVMFWRSITKDNVTTWYGKTPESRISDPADPTRIFSWLICESYDDKGNVATYSYKPEDSTGVDTSQPQERNRTTSSRSTQRYIKRILYGNRTPYFPDLTKAEPTPLPTDWCFELVFDYGEHDLQNPVPQETGVWSCRGDPFSTYRATFEIRTYRLCRRALMFHHFANEANVGLNCLVRSMDLTHASAPPPDPTQPYYAYLLSVAQTGYVRDGAGGYLSRSLPPLEFEYTAAELDDTVRDVDAMSLENLPAGIDTSYRWVDLDGEGAAGILTEQGANWFYKPNLSPANLQSDNGQDIRLPQFGPVELIAPRPSVGNLTEGGQLLLDLSGDGQLDLVDFGGPAPGYYERTEHESWKSYQPFSRLPVLDWKDPNLRFVDLTGDGLTDILLSEDGGFWWREGFGAEGFGRGRFVPASFDEEQGPQLVFADGTDAVFLANMSGDGLT